MRIHRHFEYSGHQITLAREEGQRVTPHGRADECDQFWYASIAGTEHVRIIPSWECGDIGQALHHVHEWIDAGMPSDGA